MQGTPETMQKNPQYNDVVEDIFNFLQSRIKICMDAGIDRSRIVADPGFGFGKTFDHNMTLIDRFERFNDLGVTLLAGVSRKSFIGKMSGDMPVDQRVAGSVMIAKTLYNKGAKILRIHDVAQTRAAL
jgi:dihydropteroate synthase